MALGPARKEHLAHCVSQAMAEGGEVADAKVREASAAIARLVPLLDPTPHPPTEEHGSR